MNRWNIVEQLRSYFLKRVAKNSLGIQNSQNDALMARHYKTAIAKN